MNSFWAQFLKIYLETITSPVSDNWFTNPQASDLFIVVTQQIETKDKFWRDANWALIHWIFPR